MLNLVKKLWFYLMIFCVFTLASSCHQKNYPEPTLKIETTYGDIIVELYPEKAPLTVAAFLSYVDSGAYKRSYFYRVLKKEDQPSSAGKVNLIQGGVYLSNPKFLSGQNGIPLETTQTTGLKHENGVISIARASANSGKTEFFICIGDLPAYDFGGTASQDKLGFAAFGKVIRGMNIVKNIHKRASTGDRFDKPVLIKNIIYLNPPA